MSIFPWAASIKKRLHDTVQCHQLLFRFLAYGPLPRVPCQSLLSANDHGVNEIKMETVHRSPGNCLKAGEKPAKSLLGDRLMKAMRLVIASNGVPNLKMRSVG